MEGQWRRRRKERMKKFGVIEKEERNKELICEE
jgi:hypothetical protein